MSSSIEPDVGAEETETGTDPSVRAPSPVEEGDSVGKPTSSGGSIMIVLANAGQTLRGAQAELVLNPLMLAFETKNMKVVELALDCLHVGAHFLHSCRVLVTFISM